MSAAPDYQVPSPGDATAMEHNFAELTATLRRMSSDVPAHLEQFDDDEAACLLLRDLRETRKQLAELEAFTEAECARRLGKGKHQIPGFTVEVKGGSAWKEWRHDEVAWQVCRDLAVDPATGEIVADVVQIIDLVRARLLTAARTEWRTTILAQHSIKPSDYATWTPARKTVTLTPDVGAT